MLKIMIPEMEIRYCPIQENNKLFKGKLYFKRKTRTKLTDLKKIIQMKNMKTELFNKNPNYKTLHKALSTFIKWQRS